jgi:hypothetical protein
MVILLVSLRKVAPLKPDTSPLLTLWLGCDYILYHESVLTYHAMNVVSRTIHTRYFVF